MNKLIVAVLALTLSTSAFAMGKKRAEPVAADPKPAAPVAAPTNASTEHEKAEALLKELSDPNSTKTPYEVLEALYNSATLPAEITDFVTTDDLKAGRQVYRTLNGAVVTTTKREDIHPGAYLMRFETVQTIPGTPGIPSAGPAFPGTPDGPSQTIRSLFLVNCSGTKSDCAEANIDSSIPSVTVQITATDLIQTGVGLLPLYTRKIDNMLVYRQVSSDSKTTAYSYAWLE